MLVMETRTTTLGSALDIVLALTISRRRPVRCRARSARHTPRAMPSPQPVVRPSRPRVGGAPRLRHGLRLLPASRPPALVVALLTAAALTAPRRMIVVAAGRAHDGHAGSAVDDECRVPYFEPNATHRLVLNDYADGWPTVTVTLEEVRTANRRQFRGSPPGVSVK